jgi:hypothetical protein
VVGNVSTQWIKKVTKAISLPSFSHSSAFKHGQFTKTGSGQPQGNALTKRRKTPPGQVAKEGKPFMAYIAPKVSQAAVN